MKKVILIIVGILLFVGIKSVLLNKTAENI